MKKNNYSSFSFIGIANFNISEIRIIYHWDMSFRVKQGIPKISSREFFLRSKWQQLFFIHQRFDLIRFNRNIFHQINIPILGKKNIVLQADSKIFFADVNSRLASENH